MRTAVGQMPAAAMKIGSPGPRTRASAYGRSRGRAVAVAGPPRPNRLLLRDRCQPSVQSSPDEHQMPEDRRLVPSGGHQLLEFERTRPQHGPAPGCSDDLGSASCSRTRPTVRASRSGTSHWPASAPHRRRAIGPPTDRRRRCQGLRRLRTRASTDGPSSILAHRTVGTLLSRV